MKSVIFIIFLSTIFITSSLATVARGQFKDPKNPGKCTIKENIILSPGEEIKDPYGDCGQFICGNDGEAEFHSCGEVYIDECEFGDYVDRSLPYPGCCERVMNCG